MQKKLIALAVAGLASSAAFAQTNVTVYGIADGSFDYVWQSGSQERKDLTTQNYSAIGVPTTFTSTTSQQGNNVDNTRVQANSSYIGFKGSEDLGNGLKAIFQYEMGLDFTSGSGALAATRDSFVGLSHAGAGTIVLGNLTGPTRALGATLDVFPGATGIGANSGLIGKIAGSTLKSTVNVTSSTATFAAANTTLGFGSPASYGLPATDVGCGKGGTCTSIFDTRWGNAVAYLSPNWGGFSFAAAGVANENKTPDYETVYTNTNGVVTSAPAAASQNWAQKDTYGFDVGAKWEGMGFMAGLTYNWAQLGDFLDTQVDNLRFGAMYTGAWWSVRGMWEKTQAEFGSNIISGDVDQQKFGLGGTMTFGKTTLLAQWYGTDDASGISDGKANMYAVGALYSLSKRTMLKATWAMIDNEDGSAADFGVGAIGNTSLSASASATANAAGVVTQETFGATTSGFGAKNQGIQVGIRHAF
jgi:predicted porin